MMTNKLHTLQHTTSRTLGDVAVDGLLNGIGAGIAMAGALAIMAFVTSEPLATMFSRFNTGSAEVSLLASVLGHLAVSAIYGTIFGLLWHPLSKRINEVGTILVAVLYGLLLFAVAMIVILPAVQSPMLGIPLQFGLAHLVYGLILGALFSRSHR